METESGQEDERRSPAKTGDRDPDEADEETRRSCFATAGRCTFASLPCCKMASALVLVVLCSWAAALLGTCDFGADSYCLGATGLKLVFQEYGIIMFHALIASTALAACGALWLWCKAITSHLIQASHFLILNWIEGLVFLSFMVSSSQSPGIDIHSKRFTFLLETFWVLLLVCEIICIQALVQDRLQSIWPALNRPRQGVWLRWMLWAELMWVTLSFILWLSGSFSRPGTLDFKEISDASIYSILPILLCFLTWVVLVLATLCQTFSLLQTALATIRQTDTEHCRSFLKALRICRRGAFLQGLGLVISLSTSCGFVATNFAGLLPETPLDITGIHTQTAQCVNLIVKTIGVILLSGGYRLWRQPSLQTAKPKRCSYTCWSFSHRITRTRAIGGSEWEAKTQELAGRGISVQKLLSFYRRLGKDVMLSYQPDVHTTNDVVRLAIIPSTSTACSSYAQLVNEGESLMPGKMVTHNWSNLFRDLLASVIADALGEHTSELISALLSEPSGINALEQVLRVQDKLQDIYWICAFAVNQHSGICGANPRGDIDPVTRLPHPVCLCTMPKRFNTTPPLNEHGESIPCEMNKFDDMMSFLACRDPSFAEVVVVDTSLELFNRAWCMAELAEAQRMGMAQSLLVQNKATLRSRRGSLEGLKVQEMTATRPEDVDAILSKIPDKEEFNRKLQELIFDENLGLLTAWTNADASQRMEEISHVSKWARISMVVEDGAQVWRQWAT
ncbi:unnamed protein product [Durusdinium trenchii]|uniref:Uncharacterized protein n=1 Tax=Durusdinium trenchii TaxID=1381693 RepID=A0ABP0KCM9_9DINO